MKNLQLLGDSPWLSAISHALENRTHRSSNLWVLWDKSACWDAAADKNLPALEEKRSNDF
jgi:hypothetical protein